MSSPFIDSIRQHLRTRNYSKRTEQTYVYWVLYFISFDQKVHPSTLADDSAA